MRILIPEWEPYNECIPVKLSVRERRFSEIKFSLILQCFTSTGQSQLCPRVQRTLTWAAAMLEKDCP